MPLAEMKLPETLIKAPSESKISPLNSAPDAIRAKGHACTAVDDICHPSPGGVSVWPETR